ncbi:MAG: T9SS type A sorting domain-containing protein [Candidatus Edwardsbacteria bacterium]|nr:T9SS type A sorting domain-containing protein [Candidatus Edwardsbacteria bacterium]MBU1576694.1 T9SS type A sorting domain-containing protein [Candidatus Edwardsbacteria bacterium]MBU2594014.1 T9SS type A sorting domain-containing protein [Candidatus Edwardsbacteria bacterium]
MSGIAKDNLAPDTLAAPTGGFNIGDSIFTLNWNKSIAADFGGYWVCPEPVGVFGAKLSGIDPGSYEPDAYYVSHSSPIERNQWKWRVPDNLVGEQLIFSVTAMDRSGNIAPWSGQVTINTKALTNSNTALSTAYNNGKHLLYDSKGYLNLVYSSGDSVIYQQSWDDGLTWTPSSGFASGGTKPVPVVGYYGTDTTMTWKAETPGAGWVLKSAKRVNNGWGPEATILEAIGAWEQTHYVSPPSMAINIAGTHLAIERVDAQYAIGGQSGVWYWKLLYGFKAAGQTDYAWTVLDSTSGSWGGQDPNLASPTICLDSKGGVHIAWDYEGEIYWRGYDPYLGAWKNKINLTNSPEVFSAEPSLSFYGDVHIVWQEGNDIQHRKGNWGYPRLENTIDAITKSFYWQGVENVNNSPATASLNPVFDGNYVAWSEQSAVNPDQYNAYFANYSDYVWTSSIDYSKNPSQPAVYPQIAYRQNVDGNKMTTIWTEGTGPLYSLIARDAAGQVTAQAATDVGGEEASIYLIERDGYIVYGATDAIASTGIITVDYDSTALEYYLPTLDRDQKQTMKFTFYQEYPGKIDYIYQVWVDNVSLGSVKVPSGKSVVFEKDLPNAVTHDGEGIIKIVNLKKDKIVTCDKWELYAYDKATGRGGTKKSGGAQLAEEGGKPLAYVYAMAQNAPNPFNGQTRISYQLAKPGNVSLKVYNTLGQLVNTLIDGQQQPGIYSASWNGKDNSGRTAANGVYIYRLESGDFKATKKMVVIK